MYGQSAPSQVKKDPRPLSDKGRTGCCASLGPRLSSNACDEKLDESLGLSAAPLWHLCVGEQTYPFCLFFVLQPTNLLQLKN